MELRNYAAALGLSPVPDVAPVRFVSPSEQQPLWDSCMADQGFPVDASGSASAPPEQTDAFKLANYTCRAQYPLADKFQQPLTQEQRASIHAWYRDKVVPCLREKGHAPAEVPSLDTFLATLGTPNEYQPYDGISEAVSSADLAELAKACPMLPPDDQLYP